MMLLLVHLLATDQLRNSCFW